MKIFTFSIIGSALLFASACSESVPETAQDGSMMRPAPSETKAAVSGSGVGTVTAIDAAAGKVTLDHESIPEAGWPAMTMGFEADPAMLEGVKVGDSVRFEMTMAGGAAKVSSIERR